MSDDSAEFTEAAKVRVAFMQRRRDKAARTIQREVRTRLASSGGTLAAVRIDAPFYQVELLEEQRVHWAKQQREMRKPGYIASLNGHPRTRTGATPLPLRPGARTAGMTRLQIILSGDWEVMKDGERPYAFGPHGPVNRLRSQSNVGEHPSPSRIAFSSLPAQNSQPRLYPPLPLVALPLPLSPTHRATRSSSVRFSA